MLELVCLVQSNKGMSLEKKKGKKAKSDKERKKEKERVENKDAYDRGNGITHLPTVDMSCISQNTIVYFLSSILFLIQSLAHATYLFLLDQKKLYSDPS